ncbi:hypothetical protein [Streptomyces sp. 900105245]
MGILPWDNWLYNTDYKKDQVNSLHNQAMQLQGDISAACKAFNEDLNNYKSLIAGNGALVVINNVIKMDDLNYKDFLVKVDEVEEPPAADTVFTMGSMISEAAGTFALMKVVMNLKEIVADTSEGTFDALAEDASEGEIDTFVDALSETMEPVEDEVALSLEDAAPEAIGDVFEGASFSTIGSLGLGVFAAVGIDAIFGMLNGQKEASALDAQIKDLQDAVDKSNTYLDSIKKKQTQIQQGIVDEEKRFVGLIESLAIVGADKGTPTNKPNFPYKYDATLANVDKFTGAVDPPGAMALALKQYGTFASLRNLWAVYSGKFKAPAKPSKSAFLQGVEMFESVSANEVSQYFLVLEEFSDGIKDADD